SDWETPTAKYLHLRSTDLQPYGKIADFLRKRLSDCNLKLNQPGICIYMVKGLYPTAILYAVFLGLATTGLLAWKKTIAPQPERA
ncbi:MAG: nicotinamide mononucleotide transporter, partial [Synechococcus sp.]